MRGIWRALPLVVASFALGFVLAWAYSTTPELEAARARVRSADDTVAEARAGWRPSASVTGSYGWQRIESQGQIATQNVQHQHPLAPMSGRAALSQPVLTGGQANAQIQRAIAQVRAARADLLNAEQQILLAAATAYMDVVRDAQGLRLHQ